MKRMTAMIVLLAAGCGKTQSQEAQPQYTSPDVPIGSQDQTTNPDTTPTDSKTSDKTSGGKSDTGLPTNLPDEIVNSDLYSCISSIIKIGDNPPETSICDEYDSALSDALEQAKAECEAVADWSTKDNWQNLPCSRANLMGSCKVAETYGGLFPNVIYYYDTGKPEEEARQQCADIGGEWTSG